MPNDPLWLKGAAIALLLSTLIGCTGRSPLDQDPFSAWPRNDPGLEALRHRLASQAGLSGPAEADHDAGAPELAEGATPRDYVRLALARNPSIRAARQRVAMLAERVPQVTSLDDPMLTAAPVGEMAETAAGMVGVMTGVSQRLPTPGKLAARGRIAARDVATAVQELRETAIRVAADTRRAYWSYYFSTQAIEVTEQSRGLLDQIREVAEAKLAVGQAAQADALRASVELHTLDNELVALRQRHASAAAMLNRLTDRPVAAPLPQPLSVEPEQVELKLDNLLREAAETNPQLAKVRERIQAFRERRELAKLNRWPDLTMGLSYNAVDDEGLAASATGDDQWWLSFGFNLPIWSARLDAAEREAYRGMLQSLAELHDAQNRVAFNVRDALARVESDQQQVGLLRQQILPEAERTVEASMSGYQAGSVDFLTLVDNWRRLLSYRLMYQRNLSLLQQDLADLRESIGHDVSRRDVLEDVPPPGQP